MPVYKDEFKFTLTKPIEYQGQTNGQNEFKKCKELILRAPCLKHHYRIGNVLQAFFTSGMLKLGNNSKKSEKSKKTDELPDMNFTIKEKKAVFSSSILSLGKEINDFYDSFEDLFLSKDICFLNNNKPITEIEFNNLDYNDFKKMVLEYTVNFFIASWIQSLRGD